jgi:hypothetical protein
MNKKIAVFTQTYSDFRKELYDYHSLDIDDINFRNNFDINIFSFHNSSKNFQNDIKNSKYINNINKIEFIEYNNISYTETWKKSLIFMKSMGITHIIFLQDDCFYFNPLKINNIIDFIKNEEFDMLNLECNFFDLNKKDKNIFFENKNICIYDTNSKDFLNRGWYSFDDGPYVASIDYLENNIYDNEYYSIGNIWTAENYLNDKIKNKNIQRLTTDFPFYKRFNILGPNNWNRTNELNELKKILLNE